MASASAILIFNMLPTISSPMFEISIKSKEIKLIENNLLDFRAKKEEAPKPKYREVKAVISHYTASADECGNDKGITASGKKVSRGMIAAPRDIPFGTKIEIDGEIFVVEDRGGAIKVKNGIYHLDVYVPTKKEAIKKGRKVKMIRIYDTK